MTRDRFNAYIHIATKDQLQLATLCIGVDSSCTVSPELWIDIIDDGIALLVETNAVCRSLW